MKKVFGIKEAKAAGEFAITREQKLTVLAVVKMLGLTVKLWKDVDKGVSKLQRKVVKKGNKADRLVNKTRALELDARIINEEVGDLITTREEWDV